MSMHPLGQLITDRMSHPDNKWSLQRVVDQMESAGYRGIIGKSRLAQIRRDPVESIKGEVIFALAAGLGVTPLTVANAALASMGIEPRPSEVTDSVATVRIDPTLSDSSRELLIAMIRQMRAASPSDPSTHTPKEHRDGGQSGGSLVQLNPRPAGDAEAASNQVGDLAQRRGEKAAQDDAEEDALHDAITAHTAGREREQDTAARNTDPKAGKGRSEQGEADRDEDQTLGAPNPEDVSQDGDEGSH